MAEARPVSEEEARALFACFRDRDHVALAVSGGSDSLALMHLAARWARQAPRAPRLSVLSVDHGLRPQAAVEAGEVCRLARGLGLAADVLRWQGDKPDSGIQAAARAARYGLLGAWCAEHGAALAVAHTREDQAETVLMRLMRGSGLDGLCGMADESRVPFMTAHVPLLRPLLDVPRARLRASLRAAGLAWVEDPSNDDVAYERVRLRKALGELGLDVEALGRSARRLQRARAALNEIRDGWLAAHFTCHGHGWGAFSLAALLTQPRDIRLRILHFAAATFGPGGHVNLAGLERLEGWLSGGTGRARVFGGVRFVRRKAALVAGREPGRIAARAILAPGAPGALWDGRFHVEAAGLAAAVEVRALQDASLPEDFAARPAAIPAFVWAGQPVVMAAGRLVAAPLAGWRAQDAPMADLAVRFAKCRKAK